MWGWVGVLSVTTRIHVFHHSLVFSTFIFFSVVLSKLMCISVFGPSSSPSNSFVILLIHSAFLLCSLDCHILVQNYSVSLASGCRYIFVSSLPTYWLNFLSLFWNVLFCLLFYPESICFNLPSFASTFWFISSSCTVILPYVAFSFWSLQCLCIIIFGCFCRYFLSAFPVEFPILVLIFLRVFEGIPVIIINVVIILLFWEFW